MTIYKGKSLTINNKTYSKNVELEVRENQINIIIDDISFKEEIKKSGEISILQITDFEGKVLNVMPEKNDGKNMVVKEAETKYEQELHIKLVKSEFRAIDQFGK